MNDHGCFGPPWRDTDDPIRQPIPAQVNDFDTEVEAACYAVSRVFFLHDQIVHARKAGVLTSAEEQRFCDALTQFDILITGACRGMGYRVQEVNHDC